VERISDTAVLIGGLVASLATGISIAIFNNGISEPTQTGELGDHLEASRVYLEKSVNNPVVAITNQLALNNALEILKEQETIVKSNPEYKGGRGNDKPDVLVRQLIMLSPTLAAVGFILVRRT